MLTSTFNDFQVNISTCSNRDKNKQKKNKNKDTKQKQKQNKQTNKKKKTEKNDRLTQNFEVCYTSIRIFSGLKRGS